MNSINPLKYGYIINYKYTYIERRKSFAVYLIET